MVLKNNLMNREKQLTILLLTEKLQKLTNKKVKLIEDGNILITRRSPEERKKNYIIVTNKKNSRIY